MSLSKAASKLLAFLGIYKITATQYKARIYGTGTNDYHYNANWFIGTMDDGGSKGRKRQAPLKKSFKDALNELVSGGH